MTLSSTLPRNARPGDHAGLVLFSTRSARGSVGVRLRLGVIVLIRVPGAVVHRLVAQTVRARRRLLELWLWNRGNVAEDCGSVRVTALPGGARFAGPRTVLPGTRAVCTVKRAARWHGRVVLRVLSRRFSLRL